MSKSKLRKLTASKVSKKLAALEPRLIAVARKVAKFEPGAEWEDYYQHLLKQLLERNAVDPSFFEQTDSYILKYAEFMGRHHAKKAAIYLQYVDEEGNQVEPEDLDSDNDAAIDRMVEREKIFQSIEAVEKEVMVIELSEAFLEGCDELTSDNLTVVKMLYLGYKQTEIADFLKISKPAVSQRIKTIASTLSGFVAGY